MARLLGLPAIMQIERLTPTDDSTATQNPAEHVGDGLADGCGHD
jgi:hypothetical protein